MQAKQGKSKKAVSIIIGYVLLVTFAVIIGILVYKWMKTYVPQEDLNCPGETSLFISRENYDCDNNILTLELMNNGKFDIGGYFIYGTNSPNQQLATIDLTQNQTDSTARLQPYGVKFGTPTSKNSLGPGQKEIEIYDLTGIGRIYSLEIIPIRWQTEKRKELVVSCKDEVIKENLSCYVPCVAEPAATTCAGMNCGSKLNNCREEVDCGSCTGTNLCNSTGQCVPPSQCTQTCDDYPTFECGMVCTDTCGTCSFPHATSSCSNHMCFLGTCNTNYDNCDGNDNNGCETNLLTNQTNCGSCGNDCGSESCVGGSCVSNGGGGQTCLSYCQSLGLGFTSSACLGNRGQCTSGGGTYESGGNSECTGAPGGTSCCCYY